MLSQMILRGATGAAIRNTPPTSAGRLPIETIQGSLSQCIHDIKENAFDSLEMHLTPVLLFLEDTQASGDPYVAQCASALSLAFFTHINQNKLYTALAAADQKSSRNHAKWFRAITEELKKESQKQIDSAVLSISEYITAYVRDHISENIGTSVLAEVSGYSSGYLSRIFKQHKGISIHEYITQQRMNLARELLVNTNLRIYEIASSCGYDNTAYFIKVFKSQLGQTPQEYKQNHGSKWSR